MLWRQVTAKVLARRGEHTESKRLAREAVAICDESDLLDPERDAYAELGEVLILDDNPAEAAAALRQALDRYERKRGERRLRRAHAGTTREPCWSAG